MACTPEILREVPLFALLDDDELAVLAGQVDVRHFAARQRIYKRGDSGGPYRFATGQFATSLEMYVKLLARGRTLLGGEPASASSP